MIKSLSIVFLIVYIGSLAGSVICDLFRHRLPGSPWLHGAVYRVFEAAGVVLALWVFVQAVE